MDAGWGHAQIIVFDLTRRRTFDNLPAWVEQISTHCPNAAKFLVGNKADLADTRQVSTEAGRARATELLGPGALFAEASAKEGQCVTEVVRRALQPPEAPAAALPCVLSAITLGTTVWRGRERWRGGRRPGACARRLTPRSVCA